MAKLTFSHSLFLAALLHGMVFVPLTPPVRERHETPQPVMLRIKMGTHFGNSANAPATHEKATGMAIREPLKITPEVTDPLTIEASLEPVTDMKLPETLKIAKGNTANTVSKHHASHTKPKKPSGATAPTLTQPASAIGTPIGNTESADAQPLVRYEQILALWIHKFKRYPTEARMQNQQGTAILRLVIDRSGAILSYNLSARTGYVLLDEAVMEMVKQAKTVPAVPDTYPGGDELQFEIPIRFTLESL